MHACVKAKVLNRVVTLSTCVNVAVSCGSIVWHQCAAYPPKVLNTQAYQEMAKPEIMNKMHALSQGRAHSVGNELVKKHFLSLK